MLKHFISISSTRAFSTIAPLNIGFIGLGNMGLHMAKNLLKNGNNVTVYDVNEETIKKAITNGAKRTNSPGNLVYDNDIIISMLPSSPHVKGVYHTNDNSIYNALLTRKSNKKLMLIDSSTIDPNVTRDVIRVIKQRFSETVDCVDAPVSGGVGGAEAGTLTFMVGGSNEAFTYVKPVLSHMGKNIVHCGDVGTGQVAKVCNNLILGISMAAVAESFNLGVKLGMDPKVLASIVNTSSGRCWSSDTYNPVPGVLPNVPSSRDYNGGFSIELMKKDVGLALEAAKTSGIQLNVAKTVSDFYDTAGREHKGKDFSVVYEYLRKQI